MADKVPIRAAYSGANALTGLATFASSETIGIAHGGIGIATVGTNQLVTGNGTSAMTSESNLTFDGTILKATGDLCATVKVVAPALCIGSEYVLPTADGSAGQLMCTDGSGALAFATAPSSGADPTSTNTWTADQTFNDNVKLSLGTGGDADLYYDGTNVILLPAVVGSGKVGIGTTAPDSYNADYDNVVVAGSGNIGITIATTTTTGTTGIAFADGTSSGDNTRGGIVYDHNATLLKLNSNNGFPMVIDGSGNVGIGTATAGAKLHVYDGDAGTISPASYADVAVFEAGDSNGITLYTPDANQANIAFGSDSSDAYAYMWAQYNSGSPLIGFSGAMVGIGGTPTEELDVIGSTAGATVASRIYHSNNGNAASHVEQLLQVGGASGGDPKVRFAVTGILSWNLGVDNSDSDKFKIAGDAGLGSADLVTVTTGGDVTVNSGNLVIGTSGKGIDFSATSDAAGADSELLDDYEEGSWTPVQKYGSTSYSGPWLCGRYQKVGNKVYFQMAMKVNTSSSNDSSAVSWSGLPFTAASQVSNYVRPETVFTYFSGASVYAPDGYVVVSNTTIVGLIHRNDGSAWEGMTSSMIYRSSSCNEVFMSGHYLV